MRRLFQPLFEERPVIKLAAVLPGEAQALSAAALTAQIACLGPAQVRVLGPTLARAPRADLLGWQTDFAPQGMALVPAYAWLGLVGAAWGRLLYVWFLDDSAWRSTPWLVAGMLVTFGAIAGALVGAWLGLSPNHGLVLRGIRRELRRGRWVVLVLSADAAQADRAEDALSRAAQGPVLRTT